MNAINLDIYDVVGLGVTARAVRQTLDATKDAKTINVRINSPGGDVVDGAAIYSMLTQHPARVVVDIDGQAASMASFIAMAGSEIRISEVGRFMVHNPWGIAIGEADDLRAQADLLDQTRMMLASVYAVRSGQLLSQVLAWMDAETYFNAEQAKANGFADSINHAAPRARAERNEMQPQPMIPQAVARAGLTSQYAELAKRILAERDPTKIASLLEQRDALIRQAEGGGLPRAAALSSDKPYHLMSSGERHQLKMRDEKLFARLRDEHYAEIRRLEREREDAPPKDKYALTLMIEERYRVPT